MKITHTINKVCILNFDEQSKYIEVFCKHCPPRAPRGFSWKSKALYKFQLKTEKRYLFCYTCHTRLSISTMQMLNLIHRVIND